MKHWTEYLPEKGRIVNEAFAAKCLIEKITAYQHEIKERLRLLKIEDEKLETIASEFWSENEIKKAQNTHTTDEQLYDLYSNPVKQNP